MMICRNKESWPNYHTHQDRFEARRCWFPAAPVAASPPVPAVVPVVAEPVTWKDRRASISKAQKKYINDLHGHWEVDWSYNRASKEISDLLGSQPDRKKKTVDDPRLTMIEG